jgi:hypothetical protein
MFHNVYINQFSYISMSTQKNKKKKNPPRQFGKSMFVKACKVVAPVLSGWLKNCSRYGVSTGHLLRCLSSFKSVAFIYVHSVKLCISISQISTLLSFSYFSLAVPSPIARQHRIDFKGSCQIEGWNQKPT